jgi:hypothetical protein
VAKNGHLNLHHHQSELADRSTHDRMPFILDERVTEDPANPTKEILFATGMAVLTSASCGADRAGPCRLTSKMVERAANLNKHAPFNKKRLRAQRRGWSAYTLAQQPAKA